MQDVSKWSFLWDYGFFLVLLSFQQFGTAPLYLFSFYSTWYTIQQPAFPTIICFVSSLLIAGISNTRSSKQLKDFVFRYELWQQSQHLHFYMLNADIHSVERFLLNDPLCNYSCSKIIWFQKSIILAREEYQWFLGNYFNCISISMFYLYWLDLYSNG